MFGGFFASPRVVVEELKQYNYRAMLASKRRIEAEVTKMH